MRLDTASSYHRQYLGTVCGGRKAQPRSDERLGSKFFVFAFKLQGLAEAACTLADSNTSALSQLEGIYLALNLIGPPVLLNWRGRA
jgi:hypothetical protein